MHYIGYLCTCGVVIFYSAGVVTRDRRIGSRALLLLLPSLHTYVYQLNNLRLFFKRLPGVGSEPGSSRYQLFSHFLAALAITWRLCANLAPAGVNTVGAILEPRRQPQLHP
jgi:hypothetical protein